MNEADAHLLIVDDDERIRTLLQKFLMRHGFLVTSARDAAHARRILAGLDFDLIVLDVMMPVMSGLEVLKPIRSFGCLQPWHRFLPDVERRETLSGKKWKRRR